MTQLIEVRPLKPFVGTYPCSIAEADLIDDVLVDTNGVITKTKQPRKKFVGMVAVERSLTRREIEMILDGETPDRIEVLGHEDIAQLKRGKPVPDGVNVRCLERPQHPTVRVPEELAHSLVARGLAELVGAAKTRK